MLTVEKGVAVTATADRMVVYDSKEPVKLLDVDLQLRPKLIEAYIDQTKRLYLSFSMEGGFNTTAK